MNPRLSVLPPVVVGAVWERSTDKRASSVTFSVCLIGFSPLGVCAVFAEAARSAAAEIQESRRPLLRDTQREKQEPEQKGHCLRRAETQAPESQTEAVMC